MTTYPCFKCNGSGEVSFKHIANGVCFQCGGTGKLAYKARKDTFQYQDKPGFPVLSETDQSTKAQWDYLVKLSGDNSDKCCRFIAEAGCPYATQVYVTRKVMSRAIEIAKGKGG